MSEETPHGHGHHHGHVHEEDWDAVGDRLEGQGEMGRAFLDGAAAWLVELAGDRPVRRILDLGSGPGVGTGVLAAAFRSATVEAVDGSAPLLERATARAARLGYADRLTVTQRELPAGLDELEPADVVWASRVVHHLGDQDEAVRRMAGLLRPGGVLAIAEGGLPLRCLPRDIGFGRPGLETRLDVAVQDWFVEMRGAQPESKATVEHWPGILAGAGLTRCGSRSFLIDHPAPLDTATRAVILEWWGGVRDRIGDRITAEDSATLDRLLDPDDEAGLRQRQDLFVLTADTVHTGLAPV